MKILVHGPEGGLEAVRRSIESGDPSEYVPLVRTWLLAGPSFVEFEGLDRFLKSEKISQKLARELPQQSWAVLGGYTTRPIVVSLRAALLSFGTHAQIYESNYGAFEAEILGPGEFYDFKPEHILIATGCHHIQAFPNPGASDTEVGEFVNAALQYFQTRWERLAQATGATIHQHAFCLPHDNLTGRLEEKYAWSRKQFVRKLNSLLWEQDGTTLRVVDIDSIQTRVGTDSWWSARWFHHAKLPFNPEHLREYARTLRGHLGAVEGRTRKCLALDLDDTLWGGLVGEVGAEGVLLGNGDAEGEEFAEFCSYVKELSRAGIILAVVSKNDLEVAQSVFQKHKEMPLKLDDFSAFKASWQPKSEALKNLVRELNIGMDAVVFLDDNPAECSQVAQACSEVVVLQRSSESGSLTQSLEALRLFDQGSLTREDLGRTMSYQANARIERELEQSHDIGEFLESLEMQADFETAQPQVVPRVAQLFAKTNQFNCTKQSFSETQLLEMELDNHQRCFVCTLQDKFAQHGLVSTLVVDLTAEKEASIVNWVMSCRVFNRTLEHFMLAQLCEYLRSAGKQTLHATFIPTNKNGYVQKTYANLGFKPNGSAGTMQAFVLDLQAPMSLETHVGKPAKRA